MSTFRGTGTPAGGSDIYDQADLDTAVAAASTSAANAAASEYAAAASESNAADSETNAGISATNASNSADAAAASQSAASDSEIAAAGSASAAADSEAAAALSYDNFDDRYLGQKASDPTLDNDGNALLTGALYWNTTSSDMKVYDGAAWQVAYAPHPTFAGNALRFLRVNAGATDSEWFDLFAAANTWSAAQTIQDAYPALRVRDTSTGITSGGLWGVNVAAGALSFRYNTAAGGDFSTAVVPIEVTPSATTVYSSSFLHGASNVATEGRANVFSVEQHLGAGARINGAWTPTSGKGIEMGSSTASACFIQCYNRDTALYQDLNIYVKDLLLNSSGTLMHLQASTIQHSGYSYFKRNAQVGRFDFDSASGSVVMLDLARQNTPKWQWVLGSADEVLLRQDTSPVVHRIYRGALELQQTSTDIKYDAKSIRSYAGTVTSGAVITGPTGWTCTSGGTGIYVLTHNLNGYLGFGACVNGTGDYSIGVVNTSSNAVTVYTRSAGTLTDLAWSFVAQLR